MGNSPTILELNISRCNITKAVQMIYFLLERPIWKEKGFQFGSAQNIIALEEKTRTKSTKSGMETTD